MHEIPATLAIWETRIVGRPRSIRNALLILPLSPDLKYPSLPDTCTPLPLQQRSRPLHTPSLCVCPSSCQRPTARRVRPMGTRTHYAAVHITSPTKVTYRRASPVLQALGPLLGCQLSILQTPGPPSSPDVHIDNPLYSPRLDKWPPYTALPRAYSTHTIRSEPCNSICMPTQELHLPSTYPPPISPHPPGFIAASIWQAMRWLAACAYCATSTRLTTPEVTDVLSPPVG